MFSGGANEQAIIQSRVQSSAQSWVQSWVCIASSAVVVARTWRAERSWIEDQSTGACQLAGEPDRTGHGSPHGWAKCLTHSGNSD